MPDPNRNTRTGRRSSRWYVLALTGALGCLFLYVKAQLGTDRNGRAAEVGASSADSKVSVASPPTQAQPRSFLRSMGNLATNPLFLLLLGTALSAYLIPKFVGQSQDRQKELDLKSNLVSSLSDHSSSAISSFAVLLSSNNPDYLAYENAYRSWVENSQADKSKIAAYFPAEGEADLEKTWQQYMVVVNQFYIILDCRDFNLFRPEGLGLIQTNLRAIERSELAIAKKDSFTPGRVRRSWRGWKILQPCYQPATFGSQYEKYSLQLRDEILNGKDAAIQEILASSMPAYATHWP